MAIEMGVKPKIQIPKWCKSLLIICSVLLSAMAVSYAYFAFSQAGLAGEIKKQQALLDKTPEEVALEQNILLEETKINNFSGLVSSHKKINNVLADLENNTQPQVYFSDFNFDLAKNVLVLNGQAGSFEALSQQMGILNGDKNLKKISLSGVSVGKQGGLVFSLQLAFDPQIFK